MAVVIPITQGDPLQLMSISIDGEPYVLRVRWNMTDAAWYLDAWERDGVTAIAFGIKLVLGVMLGKAYNHPLFQSGGMFLIDLSNTGVEPGFTDLGARVILASTTVADLIALGQPSRTVN